MDMLARVIDLRSDNMSQPSKEMRRAIFKAEIGDDGVAEDPSVNELQEKLSQMLEKEAALFVPTGTMGNLIAIMAHSQNRGCEVITGSKSHILLYEQTGAAQFGGVNLRDIQNKPDGTFDFWELVEKIRKPSYHQPYTSLICVENTQNVCGGRILPLEWIDELGIHSKSTGVPLHMDGTRLFNASVGSGVPVKRIVKDFDSILVCLSKSLGAPAGSAIVGSELFIEKCRRIRKAIGGTCCQIGVLAAAGVYALDNMIERLTDDHIRTQTIASAIRNYNHPHITVPPADEIHTNILLIFCNVKKLTAEDFTLRLLTVTQEEMVAFEKKSEKPAIIKVGSINMSTARFVIHCSVTDEDVEYVIKKLNYVMKEFE